MPAPASFARRQFPGAAVDTTISGGINSAVTTCALSATTGWPTGAYTGGVLCELYSVTTGATAEKVWATDLTGSTLTIVRAADGTSATSHSAGTGIRPIAGAVDADEANRAVSELLAAVTGAGVIIVGDGANSAVGLDAKTSGRILVGNGTTLVSVAVSGDATLSAAGAVTIGADKIAQAMMKANSVDSAQYVDGSIDPEHLSASLPLGAVGYAAVTANQAITDTAVTDLTSLAVTFTAGTSRRYKITALVHADRGPAGAVTLRIREGSTTLQLAVEASLDTGVTIPLTAVVEPSAGSHTYKLSMSFSSADASNALSVSATQPAFILVEDIGSA